MKISKIKKSSALLFCLIVGGETMGNLAYAYTETRTDTPFGTFIDITNPDGTSAFIIQEETTVSTGELYQFGSRSEWQPVLPVWNESTLNIEDGSIFNSNGQVFVINHETINVGGTGGNITGPGALILSGSGKMYQTAMGDAVLSGNIIQNYGRINLNGERSHYDIGSVETGLNTGLFDYNNNFLPTHHINGGIINAENGTVSVNRGVLENKKEGQILIGDKGSFINNGAVFINNGNMKSGADPLELVSRIRTDNTIYTTLTQTASVSNRGEFNNTNSFEVIENGYMSNKGGTYINSGTTTINGKFDSTGACVFTCTNNGTYTQIGENSHTIINGLMRGDIDILDGMVSGSGRVLGDMYIGEDAFIRPGNSPGTLFIDGDFVLDGILEMEIGGNGLGEFDQLVVSGLLDLQGGDILIKLLDGITEDIFNDIELDDLFRFGDEISDIGLTDFTLFDDVDISYESDGIVSRMSYNSTTGAFASVPEPATLALFSFGLASLGLSRRKRIRRQRKK